MNYFQSRVLLMVLSLASPRTIVSGFVSTFRFVRNDRIASSTSGFATLSSSLNGEGSESFNNTFAAKFNKLSSNKAPPATFASNQRSERSRRQLSTVSEVEMSDDAETNTVEHGDYPTEMSNDERYLFDLNGYIIVRGVLTAEEVKEANDAIERRQDKMIERKEAALRNAVRGTAMYGSGPGRKDLGGVLEWGSDSKVFKRILAHPRLVPLFHGILGKGYRMDHLPFIIAQDKGAEGFQLHGGTVDCTTGEYNPYLAYTCHNEFIRTALLGCNVMLTDHDAGSGGFCVVPGSHKSNFAMPEGMVDGDRYGEYVIQPATKAGDVVLFSEGTVHGAMPWTRDVQRRVCLYRFAPATNVYGRSYFGNEDGNGWPSAMYDDLTDAQRAVLEPPYANRLDRPEISSAVEGTVSVSSRSARKKTHDQQLFGTRYF